MTVTRRCLTKGLALAALAQTLPSSGAVRRRGVPGKTTVAVIGAGAFGTWTAYWLSRRGHRVVLRDAYGAGNSRSSSGCESRIIRMSYGAKSVYTTWAKESRTQWIDLSKRSGEPVFQGIGALVFGSAGDEFIRDTPATLTRAQIEFESLSTNDLVKRFPQMRFRAGETGIFEPDSGVLLARRGLQALVREMTQAGVNYRIEAVAAPSGRGRIASLATSGGGAIAADTFVFASGPWLPKLFPHLIGSYIRPQRAEVFFLGSPPGDLTFDGSRMPAWFNVGTSDAFGIPAVDGRAFKIGVDVLDEPADPDTMERTSTARYLSPVRSYVENRFPGLSTAPVLEARVCQYEMTPTEDYLIDRHPDFDNVWLAGGGSGHGFKNGPAVGSYLAGLIDGDAQPVARFALPTAAPRPATQ